MAMTNTDAPSVSSELVAALRVDGRPDPWAIEVTSLADALTGRGLHRPVDGAPSGLVLVTTQDRAARARLALAPLARARHLRVAALPGASLLDRSRARRHTPDILVSTPGHVGDLCERGVLSVAGVRHVVLDDPALMRDMGLLAEVERVLRRMADQHQSLLFSTPAVAAPAAPTPEVEEGGPAPPATADGEADRPGSVAAVTRRVKTMGAGVRSVPSRAQRADLGALTTADPRTVLEALESSDRFRRDTPLGRIFHPGQVSFREVSPTDSLHITIDGERVQGHVDRISPLKVAPDGSSQYSLPRIVAHNVIGMAEDLVARFPRRATGSGPAPGEGPAPAKSHDRSIAELLAGAGRPEEPEGEDTGRPEDQEQGAQPTVVPFGMVDEAVHLLDCEAAPWSIQLELRVAGTLDEARLRDALAAALRRHPMARARKQASRRHVHTDTWEIPDETDIDPLRLVDCPDDAALASLRRQLHSLRVPLSESPPLRLRLARHPDGDVLMLNVNHAAMDGVGALRLLESVARAYAGDPDPAPRPAFLEGRELPRRLAVASPATRARRHLALAEKMRDLACPPARVAGEGGRDEAGYGFQPVSLSPDQTRAVAGIDHPATVNDVLLAALHLAVAGWNEEHQAPCGRIGVLVPANLRPGHWRRDTVGNFSLPARVSTTRRSRRDPLSALDTLTAQTRRKKRAGMGTALLEILGPAPAFPLWAKQAMVVLLPLTGNRLVDTATLSNLGRLENVPSFGPEAGETTAVLYSPPARMPLGLTLGAVTSSGRLHLTFRYRRRLFDEEAGRRFADRYLAELGRLVSETA